MAKPVKELEILKQHLARNNLKLTRQRENILTAFLKMEHVTAEQMYRMLAKKDPHIGLATVYRTLKLLCESGLAQEQHFGSQTKFDNVAHKGHHDHLICTVCDKIIEFENCQPIIVKKMPNMNFKYSERKPPINESPLPVISIIFFDIEGK